MEAEIEAAAAAAAAGAAGGAETDEGSGTSGEDVDQDLASSGMAPANHLKLSSTSQQHHRLIRSVPMVAPHPANFNSKAHHNDHHHPSPALSSHSSS